MLDRSVRARLRGLSKDNAEFVGLHLIAAGQFIDSDPELAYKHAQEALKRGGRVDIVREAAGLAAYYTERYDEALREFRTVRRLNGSNQHLAIMADCERGLGRPERAITLAQSEDMTTVPVDTQVELAIVVAGARVDLGENDAALAHLDSLNIPQSRRDLSVRLIGAKAAILEVLNRHDEAEELLSHLSPAELESIEEPLGEDDDDVVVFDLDEEEGEAEDTEENDSDGESVETSDSADGLDEDNEGSDDEPVVLESEEDDKSNENDEVTAPEEDKK